MRVVATFNPLTEASDTFNAGFPNGQGRIVVYNESNVNLILAWGAFSTYCPAWTAMLYCISTNNVNISWQIQSQLIANNSPISQVIVEAYNDSEIIVGTFPAPLVRQANLGNSVPLATAASAIQNDNSVAGTSILETTVNGEMQSSATLNNIAQLMLGNAAHPAQVTLTNGVLLLGTPSNQALVNNSTILIPGVYVSVSCASGVTGIIMTPGSSAGQLVFLYNVGPGLLTFAASGSHVRQGSNITVGNGKLLVMVYDGAQWATTGPV